MRAIIDVRAMKFTDRAGRLLRGLVVLWAALAAASGHAAAVRVPVSPVETASMLLQQSVAALPPAALDSWPPRARENLALVLRWTPPPGLRAAAPRPAPSVPAQALSRLEAARPILETGAPFAPPGGDETAGRLSAIFDRMSEKGALPDSPAPEEGLEVSIRKSGLDAGQLAKISRYSEPGRPISVSELLRRTPFDDGGYLLGITGGGAYELMTRATGLTHYREAYLELFGRIRTDVTDRFLGFLTEAERKIVFLVPDGAFAHEQGRMTKEELAWFLDNPERMRGVRFVFGAYDFLGEFSGSALERVRLWRGALGLPPDERRIAQRMAHRRFSGLEEPVYPAGQARERAVEEFLQELERTDFVRSRLSGLSYFETSRGTYLLSETQRGLFLTLYRSQAKKDERPREVFVPRDESVRYGRILGLMSDKF